MNCQTNTQGVCIQHGSSCSNTNPQASPRATVPTVPPVNIIINAIPHSSQLYDTSGDWYVAPAFWEQMGATKDQPAHCLYIKVSAELSRKEQWLVAIHELVEAFLCECSSITDEQVDAFDIGWQPHDGFTEPGDDPDSPYFAQHQEATFIERRLALAAGVPWPAYSTHVEELSHAK